mgnify:CR=1 FL=1|jgi:hypothetical protein
MIQDPQKWLDENSLEWDIFHYGYSLSLKDKIYASAIRDRSIKRLCLDNTPEESYNNSLAGDLEKEYRIDDDRIIKNVEQELCLHISRIFKKPINKLDLINPNSHKIDLWVNYQNATEFNPSHDHSGVLSYVIYINIPESIRNEYKEAHGNSQVRGLIQFHSEFTNESLTFNPSEDTILVFESSHTHQVYPFYSDETRITIAGNIYGYE